MTRIGALRLVCTLILGSLAAPIAAEPAAKQILFICSGNFYRSRFAEALFNENAPRRWVAVSRGLDAAKPRKTPVSPLVIEELERRHIPISRAAGSPRQLAQQDLDAADLIVLMNGDEHEPIL